MKKLAFLAGAGALCAAALYGPPLRAADHFDSANVKMAANRMADIADVYTWMTSDGSKVNLALTVSPKDDGAHHFGPAIQYVFHVEQHPAFGMAGTETKILCTFTSDTVGQCWVLGANSATADYVTGDFSAAAGRLSDSKKIRVFAGRRSDPFFFNLTGFLTAKQTVNNANLNLNAQGCPTGAGGVPFVNSSTPAALRTQLAATPTAASPGTVSQGGPCPDTANDCYATLNVMAIVIQIDKDLLIDPANKIVSVWASTHATP